MCASKLGPRIHPNSYPNMSTLGVAVDPTSGATLASGPSCPTTKSRSGKDASMAAGLVKGKRRLRGGNGAKRRPGPALDQRRELGDHNRVGRTLWAGLVAILIRSWLHRLLNRSGGEAKRSIAMP
jgi:hypothetical protein